MKPVSEQNGAIIMQEIKEMFSFLFSFFIFCIVFSVMAGVIALMGIGLLEFIWLIADINK